MTGQEEGGTGRCSWQRRHRRIVLPPCLSLLQAIHPLNRPLACATGMLQDPDVDAARNLLFTADEQEEFATMANR